MPIPQRGLIAVGTSTQPLPSRHGHDVPEADRRRGRRGAGALRPQVSHARGLARALHRPPRGRAATLAAHAGGLSRRPRPPVGRARDDGAATGPRSRPTAARFIAAEHRAGQAPRTLARRLSAIRSLLSLARRRGPARANPPPGSARRAPAASCPRARRRRDGRLPRAARGRGLAARDRAMLELFYSSALRLTELSSVVVAGLDLEQGLVRVDGKGASTRIVPVGAQAVAALRAWRDETARRAGCAGVSRARWRADLRARGAGAPRSPGRARGGVVKRVHPHLLRHSCASHLLESSGDLRARAGNAGPRRHRHHADLHPPRLPAPRQGLRRRASARAAQGGVTVRQRAFRCRSGFRPRVGPIARRARSYKAGSEGARSARDGPLAAEAVLRR